MYSLLGWRIKFDESGTDIRLTSMYAPKGKMGLTLKFASQEGHFGTMQMTGAMARGLEDTRHFWIVERQSVPGFLAQVTTEMFEKTTVGDDRVVRGNFAHCRLGARRDTSGWSDRASRLGIFSVVSHAPLRDGDAGNGVEGTPAVCDMRMTLMMQRNIQCASSTRVYISPHSLTRTTSFGLRVS